MDERISLAQKHMQRRRRLRKPGSAFGSTFPLLEQELREAHLKYVLGTRRSAAKTAVVVEDPVFSCLSYRIPCHEIEDAASIVGDTLSKRPTFLEDYTRRVEASLSDEQRAKMHEEMTLHAHFLQHIVLSTIFDGT